MPKPGLGANPDNIFICFGCKRICHQKFETNTTMKLPFCNLGCREKWIRIENAEGRRPRNRWRRRKRR